MDFKIYVIKGKENAGKTSTCWKLLHKLKKHIDYIEYWELKSANAHFDSEREVYINQKGQMCDFIIIFKTKDTHQKIAIISAGDVDWLLKKDIFFALYRDVSHIICCSRTINRLHSTMHMLKKYNQHIIWYPDITFVKNDLVLKQKYEEEISEKIYQQLKESVL